MYRASEISIFPNRVHIKNSLYHLRLVLVLESNSTCVRKDLYFHNCWHLSEADTNGWHLSSWQKNTFQAHEGVPEITFVEPY